MTPEETDPWPSGFRDKKIHGPWPHSQPVSLCELVCEPEESNSSHGTEVAGKRQYGCQELNLGDLQGPLTSEPSLQAQCLILLNCRLCAHASLCTHVLTQPFLLSFYV